MLRKAKVIHRYEKVGYSSFDQQFGEIIEVKPRTPSDDSSDKEYVWIRVNGPTYKFKDHWLEFESEELKGEEL